jgi:gamma-glutamylputrescine oxidase
MISVASAFIFGLIPNRTLENTTATTKSYIKNYNIDCDWGGYVGITMNRAPFFGRLKPNVFYAQGFSGHGIAATGLAGQLMAEAVSRTAERLDVFAHIPHRSFPGGRQLRTPALVLAMAYYRLRDLL